MGSRARRRRRAHEGLSTIAVPADASIAEPGYDELPAIDELGLRHAWAVLDANLGTVARATPARIADAARLVLDGTVIGLNLPLTEPRPPLFGREPLRHEIFAADRNTLDDRLDSFYPQGSSQWDGLRHVRAREYGFFGGIDEDFAPGDGRLGIEHWAERGIVGRGVLLDVVAHRKRLGTAYDPLAGEVIEADELLAILDAQTLALRPGDVVCVRTGWIDAYRELDAAGRERTAREGRCSGLSGSEAMARLLWNAGASAVAADNPTLEVSPGDPAVGSLHRRLIPMLGFAVGELLDLGRLASLCRSDGRWDFLFVAVPLHIPGGVGSPANAVAIR
ncbi:MAG: cyclase family protein [Solirubrobacterales bacterium]|nr:cyclase family protein [Solirubrobacterales bacterium]